MKYIAVIFLSTLLVACNGSIIIGDPVPEEPAPTPVEVSKMFNFNDGEQGWTGAFSDYPVDDADIFNFRSQIAALPTDSSKQGFLLAGDNRSDDLFMFIKYQVTGLVANARYQLTGNATFLSNGAADCFGIGGAPGESVYIKMGATELEPAQADYYMNIDIGAQSNEGNDSKVLGNIAVSGIACDGVSFAEKSLSLNADQGFEVIASPDGTVWIYIGSDSGFEGRTELYYTEIHYTLTPA